MTSDRSPLTRAPTESEGLAMVAADKALDTILIVDDEEPVRKTFREWLEESGLPCRILSAADAESALVQANQHTIDLAILDWNLGAGNDGLRLLEDLYVFNPDVVAIMITGFAQQATPLDAMRIGVRDYLDKNQDLDRNSFLAAVRKQLERIAPMKRERRLHASLVAFREAVEKILPLVQSAAAFIDPVPLPQAIGSLVHFLMRSTGAKDGVLLVRAYNADDRPAERYHAYDADGRRLDVQLVPFARSIASTVLSLQEPHAINHPEQAAADGGVDLQPFERSRSCLLATPMAVAPGIQAVLELFDKPGAGFTTGDEKLLATAAQFGTEMLRQSLADRQTQALLVHAVEAALGASAHVAQSLRTTAEERRQQPPPREVFDELRSVLDTNRGAALDSDETLRLAEAIRVLAIRYGPAAVQHCVNLVESVRHMLDTATGSGET